MQTGYRACRVVTPGAKELQGFPNGLSHPFQTGYQSFHTGNPYIHCKLLLSGRICSFFVFGRVTRYFTLRIPLPASTSTQRIGLLFTMQDPFISSCTHDRARMLSSSTKHAVHHASCVALTSVEDVRLKQRRHTHAVAHMFPTTAAATGHQADLLSDFLNRCPFPSTSAAPAIAF